MPTEYYHVRHKLIRKYMCIYMYKRGRCKLDVADAAVHYLQLSYERPIRSDILVFLVSNTEHKL